MLNIFDISGSAMNAQSIRLNTVASNLANADTISSSPDQVYKAKHPVFAEVMQDAANSQGASAVQVKAILEDKAPPLVRYEPNNPLADANGNVYSPNVNMIEEMANMMSASRSYQNNVEVFNTSKQLLLATLNLGR